MLVLDQVKKGDPKLRWVALGVLFGVLTLFGGLWHVQVVSRAKYQDSLKAQSFRNVRVPASRGRILDREGRVLAENRPNYNVNLYLGDIREYFRHHYTNSVRAQFIAATGRKPKRAEWLKLEEIARYQVASNIAWQVSSFALPDPLVLNPTAFARHYYAERAMPLPILTELTPEQIARFMEWSVDIPGVELDVDPVRFYPHASLAAHTIGYVQQEFNPKEDEEEEFSFIHRLPDYVGKTGIEFGFDEELRGEAGAKGILVNNIGYRISEETWLPAEPGKNVALTLDLDLQKAAEKALMGNDPDTRGAAVVLDCRTGDILAMASAPAYDLNMFVRTRDYPKEDWARLNDEILTPQFNRVLQGTYHPGSIFKIVVALAGFEAGVFDPSYVVHNPGYYMIGRRRIKDENALPGDYAFQEAFKLSANTYFIDVGLKTGANKLIEMGSRFNFGDRTGLVPSRFEYRGYFPKIGDLIKVDGSRWTEGDTANLSIGQGEITVTPMQVALMIGAIANGGKLMKPRLVHTVEEQGEDGIVEQMPPPQIDRDINANPKHLEWIRKAMHADVAEPGGTGRRAHVEGMEICGKTGTAQRRTKHGPDHVTWFASFAPYSSPKYVVVVMIEEKGASGGVRCAPKAKEIYQAIQKLEQERLRQMAVN